jgi:hypothetical protein
MRILWVVMMYRETKWCPSCKDLLPLQWFHRDRSKRDGRQSRCITCQRKRCLAAQRAIDYRTPPPSGSRFWTQRELTLIQENLGASVAELARRLNRSYRSVQHKMARLKECG